MYRHGQRGRGRGRGGYGARQGDRRPRIPRKKHYFETDATSRSAVLPKPFSEDLKWKFTQLRAGPAGEDYTRYELKLAEEHSVQRRVSRHSDNLQDIKGILLQKLREAFGKSHSFKLDCQARMGKLVWLGELLECGQKDIPAMQLSQFEGPPRYNQDGKPHLKNEFVTRASIKNSIMTQLEKRFGAHDKAELSLQLGIKDTRRDGVDYVVIVAKDSTTGKFCLKRLGKSEDKLAEFSGDLVCFGRYHDVRISTKCIELTEHQPTPHITRIIESIKLSDCRELEMNLKSGPMKVQLIRQREKHIFHVKGENELLIEYTPLKEHPLPHDYFYKDDTVTSLDVGHDNQELEVTLSCEIDQDDKIEGAIEVIMRLIEFSLEITALCDEHLDLD